MLVKKGQVLLITVFILTFALFILLSLLSPIRDKLIRLKEMENIYQAIANAEKGIEASLLIVYKENPNNPNLLNALKLKIATQTTEVTSCAGLTIPLTTGNATGTCYHEIYTPIITADSFWTKNDDFRADVYIFSVPLGADIYFKMKDITDGFIGKTARTMLMGSGR